MENSEQGHLRDAELESLQFVIRISNTVEECCYISLFFTSLI